MYINKGRNDEIEICQNFDFYFQILENALFERFLNGFECRESPFLHVRP